MWSYHWERRHWIALIAAVVFVAAANHQGHAAAADPLPSWHDGALKTAIVAFVGESARSGGDGFIAAPLRVAVFDMDGTLMVEKPLPGAVLPLVSEVRRAVAAHPQLGSQPAVAALLRGDVKALEALGEPGVVQIAAAAVDDRTVEEVTAETKREAEAIPNPRFDLPYTKLAYRPMIELLRYLEANGYQTWICSGSPVAYTRAFSREVFGIPPERVIGSYMVTRFTERNGRTVLTYTGAIEHINDREGKPPAIQLAIGGRPVFVGGNVGGVGDIAMMRYARDRDGPSFELLVNHDDATREFAYAERNGESLAAARQYGFHVVSIRDDWQTVFDPPVALKAPAPSFPTRPEK
jgi:phosphoserine phosphatase